MEGLYSYKIMLLKIAAESCILFIIKFLNYLGLRLTFSSSTNLGKTITKSCSCLSILNFYSWCKRKNFQSKNFIDPCSFGKRNVKVFPYFPVVSHLACSSQKFHSITVTVCFTVLNPTSGSSGISSSKSQAWLFVFENEPEILAAARSRSDI